MESECAGCAHTILLDGNMSVYPRGSCTTAISHECGLELELDCLFIPAQSATNCNMIVTINRQCSVRSDIDDTSVGIIRNTIIRCCI